MDSPEALLAGQEVRDKEGTGKKPQIEEQCESPEWNHHTWDWENSWDEKDWVETKAAKHSKLEEADSTGPSALVLVSGLAADADESSLRVMFGRYGTVRKISVTNMVAS